MGMDKKGIQATARFSMRKALIVSFCLFHTLALLWWLIPAEGYPHDKRSARVPAWLESAENGLFKWKKAHAQDIFASVLESYVFTTATWQRWWLFAPNPPNGDDCITVRAILGFRPLPPTKEKRPAGLEKGEPIYDPIPLFESEPGANALATIKPHSGYSHATKLTENLVSGNWDKPLANFAVFWGQEYERTRGKKPLGIHVIMHHASIPEDLGERHLASETPSERVVWYIYY